MEEIELLQNNFVSELSKNFYYSFLGGASMGTAGIYLIKGKKMWFKHT